VQGPNVAEFERRFAVFTGARHAIAVTSCTTALHLALLAAGVGPDDEVLVPSFTYVASANAIEYTGARPVLIDINLDTFNMDPDGIRDYLRREHGDRTKRPKCLLPVSLFGLCADMPSINRISEEYDLVVIEDAACGFAARREAHHAGTEALAGCFSFHPRKSISTGEGGMVITDNEILADSIRKLRDHGASQTDMERHLKHGGSLLPEFTVLGFNCRMTDIQGAIGAVQMDKAEAVISSRREAAARYDLLLEDVAEVRAPRTPEGYAHAYQSYVCLYRPEVAEVTGGAANWSDIDSANRERNRIMAGLESEGISVRQGTHAVHTLGYYQNKYGHADHDFPMAYAADRLSITLPLYVGITEEDQVRVTDTLRRMIVRV
jgi:dTDP-4-amino-4,6-dideoxygalactose transaminase